MQFVKSQQNIMPEKTVADFFAGIGLVELGLKKLVGQLFTPLTTAMKSASSTKDILVKGATICAILAQLTERRYLLLPLPMLHFLALMYPLRAAEKVYLEKKRLHFGNL